MKLLHKLTCWLGLHRWELFSDEHLYDSLVYALGPMAVEQMDRIVAAGHKGMHKTWIRCCRCHKTRDPEAM